METDDIKMDIEKENKNENNENNEINLNIKQDITAGELYSKFQKWNDDIKDKINKSGKKDKKYLYKLKDMIIKFNNYPTPINGVELIDIKLGSKFNEDEAFLEEDFIAEHLRRGESLFYDKNDNTYDYARIGLNKFFDYKKNFDKEKDQKLIKRVLGNMITISEENKDNNKDIKYFAYLTTKVNGENFQVSYNKKYSCWILASKNVSMALKNKEDIEFYKDIKNFSNHNDEDKPEEILNEKEKKEKDRKERNNNKKIKKQERIERRKKGKEKDKNKEKEESEEEDEKEEDKKENENKIIINNDQEKKQEIQNEKKPAALERFTYAIEFAETWFNILQERIISKNLLEQFISELGDFTLIGESVGDKKREHILVYNKRDIIFYGIVNNKKLLTENCLPLSQSFTLFKKYNLSYTEIQPSEKFNSLNDLFSYINIQYDVIFDKSLQESGEGNVVYFACEINNIERIQNLGKLKTFEYRFLRKIREKCKAVPPMIDRAKIENEEMRKINKKNKKKEKKNKKKEEKNRDKNQNDEEKEKFKINKKIDDEMNKLNQERDKKIQNLIKKIKSESKQLLNEVPNSKYNTDKVLQDKYFNFAEYIMNYRSMDSTNYFDVFASYIEIMKEKFEKKVEINEELINEIKKKFEGIINGNTTNEENENENEEEANNEEDPKEE